ncbi:MAG: hypothetical protein ACD_16C00205G0029 [uncultured bacterium]|nr:MAG: hypothetical protein ACD_16C00205G0029 [uncultured bacterium]OFW68764.1 MAG: hypothetical protein A2X70_04625 [Alphaproteobacteria bacterium GWC2_42_16]OFW73271.1 MAG: hypothetical protein A2Z80_03805 [Alphaproteobacteria bacterium GWA2_41_27]OFW81896.1 MAG: hypothetical protein A3E50_07240 [Alphaproteobacteria bacterium RIFCSPHIGHO2_12_FULL_42_100]OFW84887.1 MAG: hypothetical protein A2W06_03440 [Alphaproteobacteria bacterium RBG_16_42_14]OFW91006.1 MAG: hypothetical protein A3C41_042
MVKAKIKPRWETWESLCVEKSIEEKIQLKIIALALGKTLNAVSKKISHLGLRELSSRPGRVKGRGLSLKVRSTAFSEINRMKKILSLYAPEGALKERNLALEKGAWVQAPPEYHLIQEKNFRKSLTQRDVGGLQYMTAEHIKKWATSEGFRPLRGNLIQQGVFYWKDGRYFSKAQLLIYLNGLRLEKRLRPFALYEDEVELCVKYP